MKNPLRTCRDCGLEAFTELDLERFREKKRSLYERDNWCKLCFRQYKRKYRRKKPLTHRYEYMITRCYNTNFERYSDYGGRGIFVCEAWRNDRQAFIDWAKANGFKPELSLDRIDNNKGYNPDNCRWVNRTTQSRNRRRVTTNFDKGTRICSICRVEKPLTDFSRNKSRRTGYGYSCKDCVKKHSKEYRLRKKQ